MHEISNPSSKPSAKPKLYMTTKGLSRKHILVPLNDPDKDMIFSRVNEHIALINSLLKSHKSRVSVDCFRASWNGVTITTNSVAASSDLSLIEQYFKGLKDLISTNCSPRLPQSKSYLKILGVPYFGNNSSNPINNTQVEETLSKVEMF